MILLYAILLAGALYLMAKSRQRGLGVRGWIWFNAWAVAGVLSVFSLVTGRNTALVLFPVAAIATFWLAVNAPYWREVAGFPVGVGLAAVGVILFV
jgi:hypothetical protein